MRLHVFARALENVEISKSDGDSAYFLHLLYFGELFSKVTTLAICSAVADDSDRHRYALLYRIVRADGIGHWAQVIDEAVSGPTSQLIRPEFHPERRELNTRANSETWQYRSVSLLDAALRVLNPQRPGLPSKLEGRIWFSYFAELRNATRCHGVVAPSTSAKLSLLLDESIKLFVENFCLFQREWVYLHKNLSGKYRVTKIGTNDISYQPLKSSSPNRWGNLPDGVYIFGSVPVRVDLLFTDPDLTDYFLPNGNFRGKSFETISYLTNSKNAEAGAAYLIPATQLPASETQGAKEIDVTGESFSNLPRLANGYVKRTELEEKLFDLLTNDRHPIVSLIGRGGIGKTSLALDVLHRVCDGAKFSAILWFSSRDIDLLPSGPKPVRAHLLDERDMSKEFAVLLRQLIQTPEEESPSDLFARCLTKSPLEQPILFVFDNF